MCRFLTGNVFRPYAITTMQTHLWVKAGALQQQSPRPHALLQGWSMLAEHGEARGAASQVVLSLGPVPVAPQQRGAGAPMQGPVQCSCMWCGMHAAQHCRWRRMQEHAARPVPGAVHSACSAVWHPAWRMERQGPCTVYVSSVACPYDIAGRRGCHSLCMQCGIAGRVPA